MLSGWCGQRGKPNCKACPSDLCACRCHGANPARNKGNGRAIETVECDNGGTNKNGPAGASTPVTPGLTDDRTAG